MADQLWFSITIRNTVLMAFELVAVGALVVMATDVLVAAGTDVLVPAGTDVVDGGTGGAVVPEAWGAVGGGVLAAPGVALGPEIGVEGLDAGVVTGEATAGSAAVTSSI